LSNLKTSAFTLKPTIAQGGISHNSEASFAMLKDLLAIGISIENLQGSDKLDLELEYIRMHSKDGFAGAI
jgi:hypothetical protein